MTTQNTANITPLQSAAADMVGAINVLLVTKAALTIAFVSALFEPIKFTFESEEYSRSPIDYLSPLTAPNDKGEQVIRTALHKAHWVAMATDTLGVDDMDKAESIKSTVKACIRSAAGAFYHKATLTPQGDISLPAYAMFPFFDDKGDRTTSGQAAFDEASRLELIRAEVVAEMTGKPVVEPTEADIWDRACGMRIACTGQRQKEGGPLASIFGKYLFSNRIFLLSIICFHFSGYIS